MINAMPCLFPELMNGLGTLGVGFESHFREFANFLDGVGLPAEWSPYFNGPDDNLEPVWRGDAAENGGSGALTGRPGTRPGTPFSSWLPSAPPKDRVPQALSEHSQYSPLSTAETGSMGC